MGDGAGGVTVSRPREIVPMNLLMVAVVRDMFIEFVLMGVTLRLL